MELRPLGTTGFNVAPVALGCWPIAGVTTLGTNDVDSIATIRACSDLGINHLDTAYVYGPNGESEKLIRRAIEGVRDQFVIATKCGIHFEGDAMPNDARPETLRAECDESLRRLGTDRVELLYLHARDPDVPLVESAGAFGDLQSAGKAVAIGVCNLNVAQLEEFHAVCPISVVQVSMNMLQGGIEDEIVPWCRNRDIGVVLYWVLMKGLLAGKLPRDRELPEHDPRRRYAMYTGQEWERNQKFLDRLRAIATDCGKTVAQLVVNWTMHRPGITVALCGAKRPHQLQETAGAMGWRLTDEQLAAIDVAIGERGPAAGKRMIS